MDNPELAAQLSRIAEVLEDVAVWLHRLHDDRMTERETRELAASRASVGWPWTPNTVTQGFLAGRWLRRDGNSYAVPAGRGIPGPNSPIAGGQDDQAKVDVPSGAPRA